MIDVMVNFIGRRNGPVKEVAPICNAVIVQMLPTFPDPETGEMQYVRSVNLMVLDDHMKEILVDEAARIISLTDRT